MNNLDKQYQDLLQTILDYGVEKKDRTGTGTKSIFGYTIRHNMKEGFPLLTTKRMAWKQIVTELIWFLRGDTNIKFLVDNGCHIWDGDAYKHYLNNFQYEAPYTKEQFINLMKLDNKWAKEHGELGKIYGHGWRNFGNQELTDGTLVVGMDQIEWLMGELKLNPDSRRLLVSAWQPNLLDQMVLPPCHYGFQVYTRELSDEERLSWMKNNKTNVVLPMRDPSVEFSMDEWFRPYGVPKRAISLSWNQRSVDTFLGLPFNIASYGLLLEIIAKEVNMVPDQLIGNLGDTHLYLNHVDQAKEQIGRKYTHEERTELLKTAMGEERYKQALSELMPFGGGMSEYYDSYKIPYSTKEPYPLPKLNINTEWWDKPFYEIVMTDAGCKCLIEEDIQLANYKSHPPIKGKLSN